MGDYHHHSWNLEDYNYRRWNLGDGWNLLKVDCLENLSLPFLQILNAKGIPTQVLPSLIENTKGRLTVDFVFHDEDVNKRILQAIYKNCPNLKYLSGAKWRTLYFYELV